MNLAEQLMPERIAAASRASTHMGHALNECNSADIPVEIIDDINRNIARLDAWIYKQVNK